MNDSESNTTDDWRDEYYDEENYVSFLRSLESMKRLHEITIILTPVIIGSLLLIGLIGNVLVIWVSITTQRIVKHPIHSILVLNLAVADLIYLLSSAPYQIIVFSIPGWIYGPALCPILHFLNIQTMTVSIFTMCSMAVMRFMALTMPFKIQNITTSSGRKTGFINIIFVWILASLLATPAGVFYRIIYIVTPASMEQGVLATQCTWTTDDDKQEWIYSIVLLLLAYAIPLVLVANLYFFIGRVLCDKGRIQILSRKHRRSSSDARQEEHSEYVKTTVMVFCLIVAFLVCWFPYHLSKQFSFSSKMHHHSYAIFRSILELVGLCFSYAHACVNPIIYTFASPGWRKGLCLKSKLTRERKEHFRQEASCRSWLNRSKYALVSRKSFPNGYRRKSSTNQEQSSTRRMTNASLTNGNLSKTLTEFVITTV